MILFLLACAADLDQPQPIAYDHVACAACGMLVSDPRFSAQLISTEGRVYVFDDPACFFQHVATSSPSIAHAWFHNPDQGWLSWQEVAFTPATGAPMDGGYQAVPVGTPSAVSVGAASSAMLSRHP